MKNGKHSGASRWEATNWAKKLGARSNATAPHVGTISGAVGSFCIHYQPSDGATNYHDSPKAFNGFLADAMKNNAKRLIEEALQLMQERTTSALVACESELRTLQKEIDTAKTVAAQSMSADESNLSLSVDTTEPEPTRTQSAP